LSIKIRNIVFGCPEEKDSTEGGPRRLATFYAELLGMRILRDDWMVIARDEDSQLRLAFGDGPSDYQPPRWPDPEHPQQLHLDIPAIDLDAAEELAMGLGAAQLQDKGDYRSYQDPVGHPFCLYLEPSGGGAQEAAPVLGRIGRVVFDCYSPRSLATFYEGLGLGTRTMDTPTRVVIASHDDDQPDLAFQHAPLFKPPRWPDPGYPQQIHLDLDVEDAEAAQVTAERLGAIRMPEMGGSCPVYADPSAHPFCMCAPWQ
jgi:hypothetical protein